MAESVILEEEIDEDYEPTEEEVVEYAQWLGMDPIKDRHLFYIAREGLKAPLPEPWKPCRTHDGEIYYFNFESGESVWEHPCDEYYKKQFQEAKIAHANKAKAPLGAGSSKTAAKKEKEKKQSSASSSYSKSDTSNPAIPSSLGALKPVKGAPLKAVGLGSKQDDPLIRIENEKKLKTFKENCERTHATTMKEIEIEGKKKISQARSTHQDDMENLKKDLRTTKTDQEKNLRSEVEDDYKRRLDAAKQEHDAKIQRAREDVEYENERRLRKARDVIEEEGENEIKRLRNNLDRKFDEKEGNQKRSLEDELAKYQKELSKEYEQEKKNVDQSQIIKRLEDENEEALSEIRSTYAEKLKLEKAKVEGSHTSKVTEAGEEERRKQEREFSRFKSEIKSRVNEVNNQGNRIREMRQKLIQEHEARVAELKRGHEGRLIAIKKNLEQDFSVEEENEIRLVDREVEATFTKWNTQKSEMTNQAEFDKVNLEEEYKQKLSKFEREIETSLTEEKEKLKKDRQTTLDKLSKTMRSMDQDTDVPGLLEQISKTRSDLMGYIDDLAKKKADCGNQEAKKKETELEIEKLKSEEGLVKRQIEDKQKKCNRDKDVDGANQTLLDEMSKRLQGKEQEVQTLRSLLRTTPITPTRTDAGSALERPHTTSGTVPDYGRLEQELKDIQQILFTRLATSPRNNINSSKDQYNSDSEAGQIKALRNKKRSRNASKDNTLAEETRMIARLRSALKTEKHQIKSLQRQLEQDKRRWKSDMEGLRGKMGMKYEERRVQMQAIRGTLDNKIDKLNSEVEKLKASESWIKKREKILRQKRRQQTHLANSDSEIDPYGSSSRYHSDDDDDFKREKSDIIENDSKFNQKWGHLLGNITAESEVGAFKQHQIGAFKA